MKIGERMAVIGGFVIGATALIGTVYLLPSEYLYNKFQSNRYKGEIVTLWSGDGYQPPTSQNIVYFLGTQDQTRIILMKCPDRPNEDGIVKCVRLNFPVDTKQVEVDGHQLFVREVTSELIILKYLGWKQP